MLKQLSYIERLKAEDELVAAALCAAVLDNLILPLLRRILSLALNIVVSLLTRLMLASIMLWTTKVRN